MTPVASLWPADIVVRPSVRRPLTILKEQAAKLSELTGGLLSGEVTSVAGENGLILHRFDIVAHQLEDYRHRVLLVTHRDQYYPVVLEAECLKQVRTERVMKSLSTSQALFRSMMEEKTVGPRPWPDPDDWRPIAATQEEFEKKLREVLGSPQVRGAIESLIAKINEQADGQESGGDPEQPADA